MDSEIRLRWLLAGAFACGAALFASACTSASDPSSDCRRGCRVGNVCFPDGALDPENPCAICDYLASRTAFSPNDGESCDDGQFCTLSDVCSAGICVGSGRDCDDGIACNGRETCSNGASACLAGTQTCEAGELCNASSGECVATCPGCAIAGTCYGDGQLNPLSPCEVCTVPVSRSAWSNADGRPCDDGLFCTTDDVCMLGFCTGANPRVCDDAIACDGVETCNESADRCELGVTTCTGGLICDATVDQCVLDCVGGTTMCDASCVNTASDPAHCGSCSNRCAPGEACVGGTCAELVTHTFTTCGATGIAGPSNSRCAVAYAGTTLDGEVIVAAGIQAWLVPETGMYRIEALGAQGASASTGRIGGLGARVSGEFALTAGQPLRVIVGQLGTADGSSGGGGGGSFVVDAATGLPLVVAGGGGGSSWHLTQDGCGGRVTELGGAGSGSSTTSTCDAKTSGVTLGGIVSVGAYGSAGAGFTGNGAADAAYGGGVSYAFVNGGNGGNCSAFGGFGGGGSGNGSAGGGGGGGYSGGDGGALGGGGGSFNGGANQSNTAGAQTGVGLVTVQRI